MSMTTCKECGKEVSSTARNCPHCGAIVNKPKRGFFGKIFLWLLILFNMLMIVWLFGYFGDIGDITTGSDAEQAGKAIGATIGTGMILGVWVFGDIILGLAALLTRPK